mmetsp:Transcript_30726/g.54079  ORF Transcript_30726/g.54079 Transcript_30726/m.54079 type:complete len:211 (+) Transcript_30726:463-1095(+)
MHAEELLPSHVAAHHVDLTPAQGDHEGCSIPTEQPMNFMKEGIGRVDLLKKKLEEVNVMAGHVVLVIFSVIYTILLTMILPHAFGAHLPSPQLFDDIYVVLPALGMLIILLHEIVEELRVMMGRILVTSTLAVTIMLPHLASSSCCCSTKDANGPAAGLVPCQQLCHLFLIIQFPEFLKELDVMVENINITYTLTGTMILPKIPNLLSRS